MSVRTTINALLMLIGLLLSSSAIAQTLNSKNLMDIADSIHQLSKTIAQYNNGPNVLDNNRLNALMSNMRQSAVAYQVAALNALIVEKNVGVDLRQFRFGNKGVHATNKEEMESHVYLAFYATQIEVLFFEKLVNLYPSFAPIHQRLAAINSQASSYAAFIVANAKK